MRWLYMQHSERILIRFQTFTGYHNPLVNNHWSRLNSCFLNEHFYYITIRFFPGEYGLDNFSIHMRFPSTVSAIVICQLRITCATFPNWYGHVNIITRIYNLSQEKLPREEYEIHQFIKPRYMHLPHSLIC